MFLGVLSMALGAILGIIAVFWGFQLPISDHPLIWISIPIIVLSGAFTLVNGYIVVTARAHVSTGWLNVATAGITWRLLLVYWIIILMIDGAAALLLLLIVAMPEYSGIEGAVLTGVAYTIIPLVISVLNGVNFFTAHGLFRRAPRKAAAQLSQHY